MVNFSSKHAGFLSFPVVLMSTIRTFFGAIFLSNCPKFFPNKSGVIKQVTPPKFYPMEESFEVARSTESERLEVTREEAAR